MQSETALEQDPGIHAGQDGEVPARADGKIPEVEVLYKLLVRLQQFVGN
jgi:hypothetical protein